MSRRPAGSESECSVCSNPVEAGHSLCPGCAVRHDADHGVGGSCACCGFDDARMLRRQRLADGNHTLCGNCRALARGRSLQLSELTSERFSATASSENLGPARGGNAVAKLIRERDHLRERAAQERPCECSSCRSGGRAIHRVPRFSS